jgi:hypothetical protein
LHPLESAAFSRRTPSSGLIATLPIGLPAAPPRRSSSPLERKPSATGKDKINHPQHGHDDVINAVCGAIVLASQKRRRCETLDMIPSLPVEFIGDVQVPLGSDDVHHGGRV